MLNKTMSTIYGVIPHSYEQAVLMIVLQNIVGVQTLLAHKVAVQLMIFLCIFLKRWVNYKLRSQLKF